jgi:glycosyltransferase involved in cell wall biosynthesis
VRVLYVSGTYAPAQAGAEVSAQIFLEYLVRKGNDCLVVTGEGHGEGGELISVNGVSVRRVEPQRTEDGIVSAFEHFHPDVVLTQQMWSDTAIRTSRRFGVPTVLRACRIPYEMDISKESSVSPTAIFTVSVTAQRDLFTRWGRMAEVIPPPFDTRRFLLPAARPWNHPYVIMFNPVVEKGGELFAELARTMPDRAFAVVPGWACLRRADGQFDDRRIEALCRSLGIDYDGTPVIDVDMSNLKNVTSLDPTDNVQGIYAQARVVLVPSIVEESFGRVVVEAAMNSIPVLASDVGGLRETAVDCGILIHPHDNLESWQRALESLDDPDWYQDNSERARRATQRYQDEAAQRSLLDLLSRTATRSATAPLE